MQHSGSAGALARRPSCLPLRRGPPPPRSSLESRRLQVAYRKKALTEHPDKGGSDEGCAPAAGACSSMVVALALSVGCWRRRFQLLQQAYEVLSRCALPRSPRRRGGTRPSQLPSICLRSPAKRRAHDVNLQQRKRDQRQRAEATRTERRHAANMQKVQTEINKVPPQPPPRLRDSCPEIAKSHLVQPAGI